MADSAVDTEALFAAADEGGGGFGGESELLGHSVSKIIADMAGVIITRLATEFVFRDAAYDGSAVLVETPRLRFSDRKSRTLAIREERAGRLSLLFVLVIHIRENLNGRLRESLATETTDPDDENGDESVD